MGGAGRAGNETTEVMFLNPTAVALGKGMEAGFLYGDGYWANGEHETGFAAALVENDPTNFSPGGFAYVQKRRTSQGLRWSERYFFGALAKSIAPGFALGFSAYNLQQKVDEGDEYSHWNGSLGALMTFDEGLGISYTLNNLVKPDGDSPVATRPIMQQSLGVTWLIPNLMRVNLDLTRWEKYNPDKKGIIQAGSEIKIGAFALFRFGYQIDDIAKRNSGTLGLGFNGPRLKANYSFVKAMKDSDGAMHSVDMRLPF